MTNLGEEHFPTGMAGAVPGMLGMAYQYDQLNRIRQAQGFTNFGPSGWQAENQNPIYSTQYSYDANGNILTLKRHDAVGTIFDDFTYHYNGSFEGNIHKPVSNRLYHVNDAVLNSPMEGDIEDQGAFNGDVATINAANNYRYSQLGELIHDAAEGIDEIVWRVDGKIAEIRRVQGNAKHLKFRYDAHGNRIAKHVFANNDAWESSTYYVRDAQGNVMSTYTHTTAADTLEGVPVTLATYAQRERHIYGSSRLGMDTRSVELIASFFVSPSADGTIHTTNADDRVYELTNHLGNVLATFTARKMPLAANGVFTGFSPHVTSLTDYYPFGSGMTGRTVTDNYRYGFNGMEREDEVSGSQKNFTSYWRQYDSRLGNWFSVDPKAISTPWESPYTAMGGNPILRMDPFGDKWKEGTGSQEKADHFRKKTEKMRSGLSSERESLKASLLAAENGSQEHSKLNSRLSIIEDRIQEANDALCELDAIESSDQLFELRTPARDLATSTFKNDGNGFYNPAEDGGVRYEDGVVVMTYGHGNIGRMAHELKHGYQFLVGETSFDHEGGAGYAHDLGDEAQAFQRESLYNANKSMPLQRLSADEVRAKAEIYRQFPGTDLTIHSTLKKVATALGQTLPPKGLENQTLQQSGVNITR